MTIKIQMLQIELIPDLSNCIETIAKREYQNLARDYLQGAGGSSELESRIEALRIFLESADFRKLRRDSETYLVKGQKVKFILYFEQGNVRWELIVQ